MVIAILGMGKTGSSLAKYFSQQGEEVWGIDDRKDPGEFTGLQTIPNLHLYLKGTLPDFQKVGRFFISPGIAPTHPAAQAARLRGLILEGELDLAFSLCRGEVVGITGTNGKSTTTALVGSIFQTAGKNVGVGGNFGIPFLDLVTDPKNFSHYVIEVSSFQLETSRNFHPRVAVLLNLSDDHFERHGNLSEYLRAKRMIFRLQTPEDYAVYNDDDLHVVEAVEGISARLIPFSNSKKVMGVYGDEQGIYWAPQGGVQSTFDVSRCSLTGLHNMENISAAVACAKVLGIGDDAIQKTLNGFQGLPHRIQWVANVDGVDYYDDSKATNVGAAVMSLASFDKDVVLILGGKDKGGEYAPLKPLVKVKTRAVLLLGEARNKIAEALKGATELIPVSSMAEAVVKAHELAPPGGTVLLSPACSSFDMYQNYKERGMDFQRSIRELKQNGTKAH